MRHVNTIVLGARPPQEAPGCIGRIGPPSFQLGEDAEHGATLSGSIGFSIDV